MDTGVYTPAAAGANGEAYARALGAWVPTTAHLVAPDGSSYTYVDAKITGSALHFVDRQQDRPVIASTGPIDVLGFVSQDSVAYTAPDATGRLTTWLLGTTTLHSTPVSKELLYGWAGGGAIWRVGPAARGSGIALYRLDVRTGAETIWFDVDGYLGPEPSQSPSFTSEGAAHTPQNSLHHNFGIIGFDASGHPVVQLGSPGDPGASATLLITSPQTVQTIVVPGANGPGHMAPESATGGHSALWMVDAGGHVAVYRGAGPLAIIANVPVPAGSKAELAGPCS
ncbi:MAG: hypothetical protein DLM65_04125 [Candidatus Aeolococcus gillhamiae]|uniref:Uncharacterized protein n=1 Tax=Candidatus Aeolococcus gillhamiae TaxID=3127015 RepID=A0A2W6AAF8_9BACT|nr:MAG: hypothetical protein DLM65_04125 [Candidatus Dormibacter sp. RRmetagenome_bin12]